MRRFRHSRWFTRLGLVLLIAAVAFAFGAVRAPSARAAYHYCSVSSLQGNYLGNLSGTSSSTGPLALQAQTTFDGNGGGTASVTLMTESSGPISFTSALTYTVDSNCTGTLTSQRSTGQTVHYNIAVVENATEVDLLQTDPGFVVTGVQKAR